MPSTLTPKMRTSGISMKNNPSTHISIYYFLTFSGIENLYQINAIDRSTHQLLEEVSMVHGNEILTFQESDTRRMIACNKRK